MPWRFLLHLLFVLHWLILIQGLVQPVILTEECCSSRFLRLSYRFGSFFGAFFSRTHLKGFFYVWSCHLYLATTSGPGWIGSLHVLSFGT